MVLPYRSIGYRVLLAWVKLRQTRRVDPPSTSSSI